MTHSVTSAGTFSIVCLVGEIDLHSSPDARKLILSCLQEGKSTLVDLSSVEYIDSSGVASLVEGFQLARQRQLEFGLVGVSGAALNVLKLARLDKVFPIYANAQACIDKA